MAASSVPRAGRALGQPRWRVQGLLVGVQQAPLKALAAADRAKAAATAAHAQLAPIPERFAEYAPPGSRIHRKADGAPADAAPKADESASSAPPAASAAARETASAACPPEARDAPDDESESYARMDPY